MAIGSVYVDYVDKEVKKVRLICHHLCTHTLVAAPAQNWLQQPVEGSQPSINIKLCVIKCNFGHSTYVWKTQIIARRRNKDTNFRFMQPFGTVVWETDFGGWLCLNQGQPICKVSNLNSVWRNLTLREPNQHKFKLGQI